MKTKILITSLLLVFMTGCGNTSFGSFNGDEHGIFEMRGDARGIEAYSQGMHGMIEGSKTETGAAPVTMDLYKHKETQRTYRSPFKNFLKRGGDENGK